MTEAGGLYPPALDRVDVARLVEAGGGRFLRDRLVGLDVRARYVHLAEPPPLRYDASSLTLGTVPPPISGAERRYDAVKPIGRLAELRATLAFVFFSLLLRRAKCLFR